jgi:outer membrane cobalamin receptor
MLSAGLLMTVGMMTATAQESGYVLSGKVISKTKEAMPYATVRLKGTSYGCAANEQGMYYLHAPEGDYTLVVSATGYETVEKTVHLAGDRQKMNITLNDKEVDLDEVVVMGSGVGRVKRSAFNAVALDTKELQNSSKSLSDALAKAPGMKLRESGGVGSDMSVMMDGFSGKHVKVFIDGVPQEGVGASFGLNNIPVGFANRIEVYKGVVPVGFGTDAIGGVVNIVTDKRRRGWSADASYSFGSFNTHKGNVNFGQTFATGWTYELTAFANYSDNDYHVNSPVEDFATGRIDRQHKQRVKRFNDTYHNEALVAKAGVTGRSWADRLLVGLRASNVYKEIQTGVRQEIVYGEKHRRGHALSPSVEYAKQNLFTRGLDVNVNANYNRDVTINVDTADYKYNWLGEREALNSPGEQSYQHQKAVNHNWSGTATVNYRIGRAQTLTFNHVLTHFRRVNTSLLTSEAQTNPIDKETAKNISGLQYRLMPTERWNVSAFAKYYNQKVSGPVATTTNGEDYVRQSRSIDFWGFGAAGTYFLFDGLQAKLSYERACRLPSIEEMFGDEDLETGEMSIRPEQSHNVNVSLSYTHAFGRHSVYAEAGVVYRNTDDYIQRNIASLSGGKYAATYVNYGNVLTRGLNLSARYGYGRLLSVGGNFTSMKVTDNMKTAMGSQTANINYKERMSNLPYLFSDCDVNLYWHDLGARGNVLTLTYDNQFLHSFTYYSSRIGANKGDYVVPNQFAHNVTLSYSLKNGRYTLSAECQNLTDEKLYDNFSLQKAGRAFYGKIRVHFGK